MNDSRPEPADGDTAKAAGVSVIAPPAAAAKRGTPLPGHRRVGKHADEGHELSVTGGLAALSLDALSSVAYGPEAMVLVLVAAGTGALRFTVPLTLVITGMLGLLVVSYTQVIAAHPEGGGAYAVAKLNLGRVPALLAAAALFVDYVLTVAVSLAAGAASLGSVFPGLSHQLLLVGLVGLALLSAVNMFGIAESARLLMLPAAVFIVSILAVIVVGAFHPHPVATIGSNAGPIHVTAALGIILILKAFAAGCSAVKLPVDPGLGAIHPAIPSLNLPAQDLQVRDSSGAQALPGEDADFDFRLVEPTSMPGCVVNREAVPHFAADVLAEQIGQ